MIVDSSQLFETSYTPSINPRKTWCLFRPAVNPFSALLGRGNSLSVTPCSASRSATRFTTRPVRHPVIILSFTSIARTVQEEFSNRQKWIYVNIDIDKTQPHSAQVMKCIIYTKPFIQLLVYTILVTMLQRERENVRDQLLQAQSQLEAQALTREASVHSHNEMKVQFPSNLYSCVMASASA